MSGAPVIETFAPDLIDGEIIASFFRRITLNGLTGTVNVTVDALDGAGAAYLSAMTTAELVDKGAVAARVELKTPPTPQPDAGTPSDGGGGAGGSGGGSGGGGSSANLITNGDFAAGMDNWRVDNGNGSSVNNGRLCLTNLAVGRCSPGKPRERR